MMPGNLALWQSFNDSLGSWVIITPTLATINPISQDLIQHTWTQGAFHYWQLSVETADGLLTFSHCYVRQCCCICAMLLVLSRGTVLHILLFILGAL